MTTQVSGTTGVSKVQDGVVVQWKLAAAVGPLGVGQTWQDVSASRAFGTTYTNTTGRPIQVSLYVEATAANQTASLIVDTLTIGITGASGAANNGGYGQLMATIPSGSTYSVVSTAAARGWKELR